MILIADDAETQSGLFNQQSPHPSSFAPLSPFPYALTMRDFDRNRSVSAVAHRVKPSGRLWNPSADVYRSSDGWIVKIDLAGVCSDDLEIQMSGNRLYIRGCRKDTFYREGFVYHQMEITYSRFEKTIEFPAPLEGASLARDYRDGFLIIRLQSD